MLTGYLHPDYASSWSEFGAPLHLSACGGWLLRRPIGDTTSHDAMGCYPLFCCSNWSALPQDLNAQRGDLVSIVMVADPLGDHTPELLETCFDYVRPFKDHFVVETGPPPTAFVHLGRIDLIARPHRLASRAKALD